MASDCEASCIADPNFAVICSFLERFAESCGIFHPTFTDLQNMLENSEEVDKNLIELHVKLLRKARKSVSAEKWERALAKFGHTYCTQDGFEIERFGYKKAALATKLRLLKGLLEAQFDLNIRFKSAINKLTASELRTLPLGRDSEGQVYWGQQDSALNLRVYREDEQEETWTLIAKDRETLAELIGTLSGGRLDAEALAAAADDEEEEEEEEEDEDESSSLDDENNILLDTGQPEEVQPPASVATNGSASHNGVDTVEKCDSTPDDPTQEQFKQEEAPKESKHGETPSKSNKDESSKDTTVELDSKDVPKLKETQKNLSKNDTKLDKSNQAVNLSIPSLLPSSQKRKLEDKQDSKKRAKSDVAEVAEDSEFGEAIEEPLMLVSGPGAGAECDTGNPGEEDKEKKKEEPPPPPKPPTAVEKKSRWDNSKVSPPKSTTINTGSSGKVSDWVRDETKPEDKPSIFSPSNSSPNKSSLWSIDKICAPSSSSTSTSVFSAGMLFGNLSKPSFSSPPKLTDPQSHMTFGLEPSKSQDGEKLESVRSSVSFPDSLKHTKSDSVVTKISETEVSKTPEEVRLELVKPKDADPETSKPLEKTQTVPLTSKNSQPPLIVNKPLEELCKPQHAVTPDAESSKLLHETKSELVTSKVSKPPSVVSQPPEEVKLESVKPQHAAESSTVLHKTKPEDMPKVPKHPPEVSEPPVEMKLESVKPKDAAKPAAESSTVLHETKPELDTSKVSKPLSEVTKSELDTSKVSKAPSGVSKPTEEVKLESVKPKDAAKPDTGSSTVQHETKPELDTSKVSKPLSEVSKHHEERKLELAKPQHAAKPDTGSSKVQQETKPELDTSKISKAPSGVSKPQEEVKLESAKPQQAAKPDTGSSKVQQETKPELDTSKVSKAPSEVSKPQEVRTLESTKPQHAAKPDTGPSTVLHKTKPELDTLKASKPPSAVSKHHEEVKLGPVNPQHAAKPDTGSSKVQQQTKPELDTSKISKPPSEVSKPQEEVKSESVKPQHTAKTAAGSSTVLHEMKPELDTSKVSKPPSKEEVKLESVKPQHAAKPDAESSKPLGVKKSDSSKISHPITEEMKNKPVNPKMSKTCETTATPSNKQPLHADIQEQLSAIKPSNTDSAVTVSRPAEELKTNPSSNSEPPPTVSTPPKEAKLESAKSSYKPSSTQEKLEKRSPTEPAAKESKPSQGVKPDSVNPIINPVKSSKDSTLQTSTQKELEKKKIETPSVSNLSAVKVSPTPKDNPSVLPKTILTSEQQAKKPEVLEKASADKNSSKVSPSISKPQISIPKSLQEPSDKTKSPQKSEAAKEPSSSSLIKLCADYEDSDDESEPEPAKIYDSKIKQAQSQLNVPLTQTPEVTNKVKTVDPKQECLRPSTESTPSSKQDIVHKKSTNISAPTETGLSPMLDKSPVKPKESVSISTPSTSELKTDKMQKDTLEGNKVGIERKSSDQKLLPSKFVEETKAKAEEKATVPTPSIVKLKTDKMFENVDNQQNKVESEIVPKKVAAEKVVQITELSKDSKIPSVSNVNVSNVNEPGKSKEVQDKPVSSVNIESGKLKESSEKLGVKKVIPSNVGIRKSEDSVDKSVMVAENLEAKRLKEVQEKNITQIVPANLESVKLKVSSEISVAQVSSKNIPGKSLSQVNTVNIDIEKSKASPVAQSSSAYIESGKLKESHDKIVSQDVHIESGSSKASPEKARTVNIESDKSKESAHKMLSQVKPGNIDIEKPKGKVEKIESKIDTASAATSDSVKTMEIDDTPKETSQKVDISMTPTKSGRRKSLENISASIMKEKMKCAQSEVPILSKPSQSVEKTKPGEPEPSKSSAKVEKKIQSPEIKEKLQEQDKSAKPQVEKKKSIEPAESKNVQGKKLEEKVCKVEVKSKESEKKEIEVNSEEKEKLKIEEEKTIEKAEKTIAKEKTVDTKVAEKELAKDKKVTDESSKPEVTKISDKEVKTEIPVTEVTASKSEEISEKVTRTRSSKKVEAKKVAEEQTAPVLEKSEPVSVEAKTEPVTIGSALSFDYDPPPSPPEHMVIAEAGGRSRGRPQRAVRGRGRPPKSQRGAASTPDQQQVEKTPEKETTPVRGKGRARATPRGRRVEQVAAEGESAPDSNTPDPHNDAGSPGKRVSRRIAQIKQKEEEDRKKQELEEMLQLEKQLKLKQQQQEEMSSSSSEEKESSDQDASIRANGSPKKKRKRKNKKHKKDEDYIGVADEDIAKLRKKKKRKKLKKKKKAGKNPWESSDSSDSSSQASEGMGEDLEDDDDDEPRVQDLKSDHEFSPESDLELGPGEDLQPAPKRARTARRVSVEKSAGRKERKESETVEVPEVDEYRCQKCNAGDRPETILLCDNCDNGWHISCLRPEVYTVPEGDWFCPECSNTQLITGLTKALRELDRASRRRKIQELRNQRLAYVNVSLANVIPSSRRGHEGDDEDDDEEDPLQSRPASVASVPRGSGESSSEDSSSGTHTSESEESEGKYPLRQRRAAQTVSYSFQAYDDLMKSAIQADDEEEEEPAAEEAEVTEAGNAGRGKDISTIENAQKEELEEGKEKVPESVPVPEEEKEKEKDDKDENDGESSSDEEEEENEEEKADNAERERQHAELVKLSQRRKPRRLACLDASSEDGDHASDEDFHGSSGSSAYSDEEQVDSDSSEGYGRKGRNSGPVRRSTRARQTRFDREFINDSEEDSEEQKKKRKKRRFSDDELNFSSEESSADSDWRGKKKRKAPARSRAPAKRRKRSGGGKRRGKKRGGRGKAAPARKRVVRPAGSDSEVAEGGESTPAPPKAKKPKPPPKEREPSPEPERRTTRGRKMNYQEIIGSDSDDAVPRRGKGRRIISDEEDEFRPDEEDAPPRISGKPASVLHAAQAALKATQLPVVPSPAKSPAEHDPAKPVVPGTALILQQSLGAPAMPRAVEVMGKDSEPSDEETVPPTPMAPKVTPPVMRGAVRRGGVGRGRGRGRPPGTRNVKKVTVSSDSDGESDPGLPATLPHRAATEPSEDIPKAPPPAYAPATAPVPPQFPPSQTSGTSGGGVISRLLQTPPTSAQPFTAAAAASIAAKFYPPGGAPPGYPGPPPPRQQGPPPRFPPASPMNYRPIGRLRAPLYPIQGDKPITPPPAYRPPMSGRPPFPPQRFPSQQPQPYPTPPGYFFPVQEESYPPFPEGGQPQNFSQEHTAAANYEQPPASRPTPAAGEEEGGEFGGLVSYFSSQREDDLES